MLRCHIINSSSEEQALILVDDAGRKALITAFQDFRQSPSERNLIARDPPAAQGHLDVVLKPAQGAAGMAHHRNGLLIWNLTPAMAAEFAGLLDGLSNGSHQYLDSHSDQMTVKVSWGEYPDGAFTA